MNASSDLHGATAAGDPGVFPASPGDFAARWNAMDEQERADFVDGMVTAWRRSHDCWAQLHVPGETAASLARSRAEQAGQAAREALYERVVEALEVAGMQEASQVVDALAALERWEVAGRGA